MAGVNKAIILGRVGKDPEVRSMNNGGEVVSFSVATSETWKDKQSGERQERTEWHNVVIFNEGLGGIAKQYLRKGSEVYLEGAIQTRKWTDQSGNDKYTTEIVLQKFQGTLSLIGGRADSEPRGNGGPSQRQAPKRVEPQDKWNDLDDDIPFISCDPRHEYRVR